MKRFYSAAFFLVTFSLLNHASAAVRDVPGSYATIQLALNACTAGDTVLVQPGLYAGGITWPNTSAIKMLGVGDSSNTVITGYNANTVITFLNLSLVDTNTVIRGFKIKEGYSTARASGIEIHGCSPKIERLSITDNHVEAANWAYSAGVYCNNSDAVFQNSSIIGNRVDSCTWGYGGGLYISGTGTPKFFGVNIDNNVVNSDIYSYSAGVFVRDGSADFLNCSISGNQSLSPSYNFCGGMFVDEGHVTLTNVLIASNILSAGANFYDAVGLYVRQTFDTAIVELLHVTMTDNRKSDNTTVPAAIYMDGGPFVSVVNSILWNTTTGSEISGSGTALVSYTDVRGGSGGAGNIAGNPDFVSAADFHLANSSPCIYGGTLSGSPAFDLENMPRPAPAWTNPDMGCYESIFIVGTFEAALGENKLRVYPNPATSEIVIALEDDAGAEGLTVVDMTGKIVLSVPPIPAGKFLYHMPLGDLSAGMYALRAGTVTRTFMKQP